MNIYSRFGTLKMTITKLHFDTQVKLRSSRNLCCIFLGNRTKLELVLLSKILPLSPCLHFLCTKNAHIQLSSHINSTYIRKKFHNNAQTCDDSATFLRLWTEINCQYQTKPSVHEPLGNGSFSGHFILGRGSFHPKRLLEFNG